jgi:ABC-type lipoprotein release transport system permease subunit
VIEDIPANSTLTFDMLIPYEVKVRDSRKMGMDPDRWGWFSPSTFIRLHPEVGAEGFQTKIADFIREQDSRENIRISLIPFTQRNFIFWNTRRFITIYSVIAAFVLLVACINFMNLSTARATRRAGEIGLRKVIGADRRELMRQFFGETFLMVVLALMISLLITVLLLPSFNELTQKQLTLGALIRAGFLPVLLGLVLLTGFLAGSYPAMVLSAFKPVRTLQGQFRTGTRRSKFRKTLVVFQFTLSVFLLIGSGIVFRQLEYMKARDMGYQKDQLVSIKLNQENRHTSGILTRRLAQEEGVLGVTTVGDDLPFFGWGTSSAQWEGKDPNEKILLNFNAVGYDFCQTLGVRLLEGRPFASDHPVDMEKSVIINETLRRMMGLESAEGVKLTLWNNERTIIGVMQDMHFQPLTAQINPMFLVMDSRFKYHVVLRVQTRDLSGVMKRVERVWKEVNPGFPFPYRFIRDDLDRSYRSIERMGSLSRMFTALAVFIAAIGLFGLAAYTGEQRSREIAIRKVLGSSVPGIMVLISKEFVQCVLAANLIAWPAAYLAAGEWLRTFAYRIRLDWESFIVAAVISLAVALIAVSAQAMRAARADLVDRLKYE